MRRLSRAGLCLGSNLITMLFCAGKGEKEGVIFVLKLHYYHTIDVIGLRRTWIMLS